MKLAGAGLIPASFPRAKGRVERANGTRQDAARLRPPPRMVNEMQLAGVSDAASANAFLENTFLPAFNRKFRVEPREAADLHVPLSKAPAAAGRGTRLDDILCRSDTFTLLRQPACPILGRRGRRG